MACLLSGPARIPPLDAFVRLAGRHVGTWVLLERIDTPPRLRSLVWDPTSGRLTSDPTDEPWSAWERARAFCATGDLRWERARDGVVRWTLIADAPEASHGWPPHEDSESLPEPPMFTEDLYLWGVYDRTQGGWVDQRIPQILHYPIADPAPGCRVRLSTRTYVSFRFVNGTQNHETRIVRLCGLREEEAGADHQSL